MVLDPVVHGVSAYQPGVGHSVADLCLQNRVDVGEKEKLRVQIFGGQLWLKTREHVEIRLQRLGFVDVLPVLALPKECLALRALNATGIDAALVHHGFVVGREVIAHDAHHANIGEVAGSERKICGGAAENLLAHTVRGFKAVKRDRTNNNDGQGMGSYFFSLWKYLPTISFRRSSVAAGTLSFCVMIAWLRADPHLQPRSLGMAATASRTTLLAFSAFFTSTPMICSTVT